MSGNTFERCYVSAGSRGLTECQAEVLAYLKSRNTTPSFEEIKNALGYASKSKVHRIIEALAERGRITRLYDRARSIRVLDDSPLEQVPTSELLAELSRRKWREEQIPATAHRPDFRNRSLRDD